MRLSELILCSLLVSFSFASKKKEGNDHVEDPPRGVSFQRAPLYKPGAEFQCLDGSKNIPYDHVNDDYCDCPDGSDEPGTSACPNGQFFCVNRGHTSEYIPSSRVGDRICDCCDGSDEYEGKVQCPNICEELGASAREEKERRAAIARKGFTTRQEFAKQAQTLKEEKEKGISGIKAERDALVPQREEIEGRKKAAEDKEREAKDRHRAAWEETRQAKKREEATVLFEKLDINGDKKITIEDFKASVLFDTDGDGTVTDDEAKLHLSGETEADLEAFIDKIYDGIKLIVREKEKKSEPAAEEKKDEEPPVGEANEEHRDDEEAEQPEERIVTAVNPPLAEKSEEDENEEDASEDVAENDDADDNPPPVEPFYADREPPYDEETQKLIDEAKAIRDEYYNIDNKIRELDNQIKDAETFLSADFGPDGAWAALKGSCYEMDEGQYTYKLCPFDKTIQKDKNGHSETTLGHWKEWSGQEPLHKYHKQRYDKGQQCWNGPERSTDVIIECGDDNALVEASEPGRCEYRFVFRTPAACNDPDKEEPIHTEL